MSTKKFKTNIKCDSCVAKVTAPLNETVGEGKWRVDLKDPLRALSIDGEVDEVKMKKVLEAVGYKAEKMD